MSVSHTIRSMQPCDIAQKAAVDCQAWRESYAGLLDAGYLTQRTAQRCMELALHTPHDVLLAQVDGKTVGFAAYGPARGTNEAGLAEVYALYVLKDYQGRGIGRDLINECLNRLSSYPRCILWVLQNNCKAIAFYRRRGYVPDGSRKRLRLGSEVTVLRMACAIHQQINEGLSA